MTMTLCLLTLKKQRPSSRYVLWSRIDQKSCFKSILTANLEPIIIEQIEINNYLQTNLNEFEKQIQQLNPNDICCIISTTSCFAPRAIDNIQGLSHLCQTYSIPHLINNAYGLQSTKIVHEIEQTKRSNGRIDYIVQSTDKNFLVPVGGSIVLTYNSQLFDNLSHAYPGRASITPTIDIFITLLSMGKNGLIDLIQKRKNLFHIFYDKLSQWAKDNDESVLSSKQFSPISIAISLKHLPNERLTELGSMLFTRRISGARVIKLGTKQKIDTYEFMNYGAHSSNIQYSYLTVAAAIGIEENDIDIFMKKFDNVYQKLRRNQNSDDD
jgi:O-phospho-L-seryl-tRNASec:L-selenocysteinyl-tRNA synthase